MRQNQNQNSNSYVICIFPHFVHKLATYEHSFYNKWFSIEYEAAKCLDSISIVNKANSTGKKESYANHHITSLSTKIQNSKETLFAVQDKDMEKERIGSPGVIVSGDIDISHRSKPLKGHTKLFRSAKTNQEKQQNQQTNEIFKDKTKKKSKL